MVWCFILPAIASCSMAPTACSHPLSPGNIGHGKQKNSLLTSQGSGSRGKHLLTRCWSWTCSIETSDQVVPQVRIPWVQPFLSGGHSHGAQSHHTSFFLAEYTSSVPAPNWESYPLHQRTGDYSFVPKTPVSYLWRLNHHIICGKKMAGSKIRLQRFKMSFSDKHRPGVFKSTHNQVVNLTITARLRHQEYKYRLDKFWEDRSITISTALLLIKSKGSGAVSAVVGLS